MRRDCDGDEAGIILLADVLLNFSSRFLSGRRGSTMDAPLVLTSVLEIGEVDDMVLNMDRAWRYPLAFYETAVGMGNAWDVPVPMVSDLLADDASVMDIGYTHETTDINDGVLCSSYRTIPSMIEKVRAQMRLAGRIDAVDVEDTATGLIRGHFLKDIKGNLRKFCTQSVRCTRCSTTYRRPPLTERCMTCGGRLRYTLTEGSVRKYLPVCRELIDDCNIHGYLAQEVANVELQTDMTFGRGKESQTTLE